MDGQFDSVNRLYKNPCKYMTVITSPSKPGL